MHKLISSLVLDSQKADVNLRKKLLSFFFSPASVYDFFLSKQEHNHRSKLLVIITILKPFRRPIKSPKKREIQSSSRQHSSSTIIASTEPSKAIKSHPYLAATGESTIDSDTMPPLPTFWISFSTIHYYYNNIPFLSPPEILWSRNWSRTLINAFCTSVFALY